jgi:ketosteroid isomerase-like protein
MTSLDIRAALERHWAASDVNDFETEHEIYCDDAILDYPQSGERIRGRRQIMEFRDGKVAHETQYFGDPFEPGSSRAQWVERIP